jgi:hypothetical protein
MSTSLRDQLLKAGLINQQQANEVERQQDRQHRQQTSRRGPAPQGRSGGPPARPVVPTPAAMPPQRPAKPVPRNEKALRDLKLNQQKAEKAEKRARAAQLRQLIEHHRLPPLEQGELYNFIDVDKVRCVRVDADRRARIVSGDRTPCGALCGRARQRPAADSRTRRTRDRHCRDCCGHRLGGSGRCTRR